MSEPTTFEAHGQTWNRHAPGDWSPVPNETEVYTCHRSGRFKALPEPVGNYYWGLCAGNEMAEIIGWRYATPQPQEPDELATLRIKLEDAETVIEDIASDVAEFAADGDSPNAGPRDRLAAKVYSHISAHRASAQDSKLSWKDKQLAGLEESLRAAKEQIIKDEAELELMLEAIREAINSFQYIQNHSRDEEAPANFYWNAMNQSRAALAKLEPFLPSK